MITQARRSLACQSHYALQLFVVANSLWGDTCTNPLESGSDGAWLELPQPPAGSPDLRPGEPIRDDPGSHRRDFAVSLDHAPWIREFRSCNTPGGRDCVSTRSGITKLSFPT